MATVSPAQSPGLAPARQVPKAPLPTKGVTSRGVMSCTPSSPLRLIITWVLGPLPRITPQCFFGALTRFFPKNIGLTLELK